MEFCVFSGEIIFICPVIASSGGFLVDGWFWELEGCCWIFPCWFQMISTHVFLSTIKLFWELSRLSYLL